MRIMLEVHGDCSGNAANDHWKGELPKAETSGNDVHLLLDYLL